MSTWEHVSSRLGNVKPETRALAKEVYEAAKAAGHDIWFIWGMGTSEEHKTGNALDLMVKNEAAGDWVRDYLWANRARLRVRHIIWEQHITSTVVQPGVRRKMADRGNSTANHYDHNHVWIFPGAYQPPPASSDNDVKAKTLAKVAAEVWVGAWGNGEDRRRRLTAAGYNYDEVQALVDQGVGKPGSRNDKSIAQLATEVIRGDWGNGDDRRRRLTNAGYDYEAVRAEVNRRV